MSGVVIKNLNAKYDEKVIFNDFNIAFEENKISVILGGSGVGKTTLLNVIAKLKEADGSVEGNNEGISYIFQKDRLIPTISVYKNLDLVLKGVEKDKILRKKNIESILALLEISDQSKKLPTELSGGQVQRVALARAFLFPSKVMLLDEPFKALDTALKTRLLTALIKLQSVTPRTVIFVTHAIDECLLAADKYYVLSCKPASVVCCGNIDKDKSLRKLSDMDLDIVRNTLLKILCAD